PQPKGALGMSRDYANDPHMAAWYGTVHQSQAYQALAKVRGKQTIPVEVDGKTYNLKLKGGYAAYLLEPKELWARCYAQYIATRGDDAELKDQLESLINGEHAGVIPLQWSHHDFEPIAKQIDAMFAKLGWRPHQ
ncbi:MAG: hypothetical protein KGR26_05415, partial [Cyanobacteria bacterium REEB65]|nr:hypothetical protein [Cyanobacteria bacterium REEB65]